VYGRDLSQFNALDEIQLQFLLSNLKQLNPASVLDLGCGLGRITEFVAQNLDAEVTGLDFADQVAIDVLCSFRN
jgi:2-polyprenyl-3-methyl-5-hydroxy-6-metoxy-1,4-benzoquinol methylase